MSIVLKQQLYDFCKSALNERLTSVQGVMAGIQKSLLSETKSTAGDKHETGRAMLQLEREKTGRQIAAIEQQLQLLARIDPETTGEHIHLGSLVYTANGCYFMAIGLGLATLDNQPYFIIAPQAPIGKLMLGKQAGDTFEFNGKTIQIESVV